MVSYTDAVFKLVVHKESENWTSLSQNFTKSDLLSLCSLYYSYECPEPWIHVVDRDLTLLKASHFFIPTSASLICTLSGYFLILMADMVWTPKGPPRFKVASLTVSLNVIFKLVVHEESEVWTSLPHSFMKRGLLQLPE